jgi:hypothetical protein
MKWKSVFWSFLVLLLFVASQRDSFGQQNADNTVVSWNNLAMQSARNNNARGLLMLRALAIMHTSMFDAWGEDDNVAIPTLGHPALANKREAVS